MKGERTTRRPRNQNQHHVIAILLFLFSSFGAALASDKESAPDFSDKYPQVKGFLHCINLHTNATQNLQQTNFLVITEFYRMDRLGGDMLRYVVSESGQTTDGIDDGSGTIADPHRKQLSKDQLKNLRSVADQLPKTNQYPWLSSLVIVSHRDGTNWVTHSYSRHRSPDDPSETSQLRALLKIVGERPESQETHPF